MTKTAKKIKNAISNATLHSTTMEPTRTLDEHLSLLQRLGYTEKVLHMQQPNGKIADTLREAYLDVMNQAARTGNMVAFTMVLPAQFDSGRDKVEFRLNFRYHPDQHHLQITAMSARMGPVRQLFITGASNNIAHANSVYQLLCNKRTQQALKILSSRKINPIKSLKHI